MAFLLFIQTQSSYCHFVSITSSYPQTKDIMIRYHRMKGRPTLWLPGTNHAGIATQSVHLVAGEGLEAYLPLADMVDISAEVQRLSKRLSKMQTEYDGLLTRLSSPNFVEKAPEEVVRGVREKAAEAEEKLNLTKNRLSFLQSTILVSE